MARLSDARVAVIAVLAFTFILTVIAFFSRNWLASERRNYGAKFDKLGLWETCFRSLPGQDINDDFGDFKFYSGCRWIFSYEYQKIRSFLLPGFFVSTQIFYTIGFISLLATLIIFLSLQLCELIDNEIRAFKIMALTMFVSAITCTIAVIVFGIRGDDSDWMMDHEHNFLSWSYGLAVVGVFFKWIAAILFWIENRLLIRKQAKKDQEMLNIERAKA